MNTIHFYLVNMIVVWFLEHYMYMVGVIKMWRFLPGIK